MRILVTGSNGFIGKNLVFHLREKGHEVLEYDIDKTESQLRGYIAQAEFIFHLAGVNRPLDEKKFEDGNINLTKKVIDLVKETGSVAPIVFTSSTQAALDNPYGRSKKKAEDQLFAFSKETGHRVFVFRLYNCFGKWCRPNYNSVIATFCYNIAHNLSIKINEQAAPIDFVYIDDVVASLEKCLFDKGPVPKDILSAEPHYTKSLNEIADLIYSFKATRESKMAPMIGDPFAKKLYSTYLSYLPEEDFSYPLDMHIDERGSFTEILKTSEYGQISVNVGKPGITKGNHYHNTKNEKYLVVKGECVIKFRRIDSTDVITYRVSDKKLEVVDIPPGYTHNITNVGKENSVTLMWANELFDPENPDTYYCPVEQDK